MQEMTTRTLVVGALIWLGIVILYSALAAFFVISAPQFREILTSFYNELPGLTQRVLDKPLAYALMIFIVPLIQLLALVSAALGKLSASHYGRFTKTSFILLFVLFALAIWLFYSPIFLSEALI